MVVVEQGAAAGAGADAAADVRRRLSSVPKFTTGFAASQVGETGEVPACRVSGEIPCCPLRWECGPQNH